MKTLLFLLISVTLAFGQAGNLGVGATASNFTVTGWSSAPKAHFMISNTNTLASAGTTNVNLVPWTNIEVNFAGMGAWSTNGSRIYFPTNGAYLAVLSMLMRTGVNEGGNARVWVRQNGNDILRSGTHVDFPTITGGSSITNMSQIIAVPFDIQAAGGDYIEIAWWSDTAGILLPAYPIGATPTRPASPSVIMTIHKTSSQ